MTEEPGRAERAASSVTRGAAERAAGAGDDRLVEHATCLGCGCACDDIGVVVAGNRIVEARRACSLGVAWFGDGLVPTRAQIAGRDVSAGEALDAIARLLVDAERPLVYLAPDVSCEAQREAVAIADLLRAALDSVTSATALPWVLAAQERGRAGATLGEVRNRADVVVFWGVDPLLRYPRYPTRYAPAPVGTHLPAGRGSRRVVAVDVGHSLGPLDADVRVSIAPADEVATLTALRAVVSGRPAAGATASAASAPWRLARDLAPALLAGRYVALVADAEPAPDADSGRDDDRDDGHGNAHDTGRAAALVALAQALNGPTRSALSTLRAGGNRSGAEAVLASQTGYPVAVDFARGYPRYRPHEGAAARRLARGEVDAALVVGAAALVPTPVRDALRGVPCAVVGPRASEAALGRPALLVDTGVAGIHEGGTALRMDDVPLPLRPSLAGPPEASALVRALRERVALAVARRRAEPSSLGNAATGPPALAGPPR